MAIDADTKCRRHWSAAATPTTFVDDLASRLSNRIQLTTDGHKAHLEAIEDAFGDDIDCAMFIKSMARRRTQLGATAPVSQSVPSHAVSWAGRTRSTSARHMSKDKT